MFTFLDDKASIINSYVVFMAVIILVGVVDLILDINSIVGIFHYAIEITFMLFALISGSYMWISYRRLLKRSENKLRELLQESNHWREKHKNVLHGMHEAVISQLEKWGLTKSEIAVALYLLRGYSLKQIGGLLEKSERTVRNQSLNVYKKTGMTGRSELTAFFLEELFSFEEID